MLNKFEIYLNKKKALGILFLRLFISLRLIYGVIDNIISWEQMLEFAAFLQNNSFPFPTFSAVLSVYIQFIAAICVLLGYNIRLASFFLIVNFLIAIIFFHLAVGDSIEGMTGALAMFFGALTFLFTAAEKYSLDAYLNKSH